MLQVNLNRDAAEHASLASSPPPPGERASGSQLHPSAINCSMLRMPPRQAVQPSTDACDACCHLPAPAGRLQCARPRPCRHQLSTARGLQAIATGPWQGPPALGHATLATCPTPQRPHPCAQQETGRRSLAVALVRKQGVSQRLGCTLGQALGWACCNTIMMAAKHACQADSNTPPLLLAAMACYDAWSTC